MRPTPATGPTDLQLARMLFIAGGDFKTSKLLPQNGVGNRTSGLSFFETLLADNADTHTFRKEGFQ